MTTEAVKRAIHSIEGTLGAREVRACSDFDSALRRLRSIYEDSIRHLTTAASRVADGQSPEELGQLQAHYPLLAFVVGAEPPNVSPVASFGYARRGAGLYLGTVTHPEIFEPYLRELIEGMAVAHDVIPLVGISSVEIPLAFALGGQSIESDVSALFTKPDVEKIAVSNVPVDGVYPLLHHSALQVDFAVERLRHYTGTDPKYFQRYILLTNYRMYAEMFVEWAKGMENSEGYGSFVAAEVSDVEEKPYAVKRTRQMPAYHLTRPDGLGISVVNIGVGPANAANFMINIAPLRPHAVMMVGHCGGLRENQHKGMFILGDAYYRDDGMFRERLPLAVPVPPIAEINAALKQAMGKVIQCDPNELKRVLQTGTVATTNHRCWESEIDQINKIKLTRAVAIDMESATIATAGFLFRVPYGTLLLVSDTPLRGDIKLASMAQELYKKSTRQHLEIAVEAIGILRENPYRVHSRKLRGIDDCPAR